MQHDCCNTHLFCVIALHLLNEERNAVNSFRRHSAEVFSATQGLACLRAAEVDRSGTARAGADAFFKQQRNGDTVENFVNFIVTALRIAGGEAILRALCRLAEDCQAASEGGVKVGAGWFALEESRLMYTGTHSTPHME